MATIVKRIVLLCIVLLTCYPIFTILVINPTHFNDVRSTTESEQREQEHIRSKNNLVDERKYDRKLKDILSKFEQNIGNQSVFNVHSKLTNAGIISKDGSFTPLTSNGTKSSQPFHQITNPHPAKRLNKKMTDEEMSITSRIQDMQTERREVLKAVCDDHKELQHLNKYEKMDYVLTDRDNRLLFAMVPKVASSMWIQLMIIHSGKFFDRTVSFHDINYRREHIAQYGLIYMHHLAPDQQLNSINNFYSWMFTRNPFERLVSAYRNKLNPGLHWYHERYGKEIARMMRSRNAKRSSGDDITFPEFIKYIVDSGKYKGFFDEHWRPMYQLAYPCIINYDFIGKFETLHEDITYVLQKAYGLDPVDDSPFKNLSRKTDKSIVAKFFKDVPVSDVEKIKEIYALDFQLFNYSTDLPTT